MSRHTTFDLLADVPEFNGKAEELDLFILHIDGLRKIRTTTGPSFLKLFDLRIRNKIICKANISLINNGNPLEWETIKIILETNFGIYENIETIVNKNKSRRM
ncbi:unnamed protein product [Ceratitis capitata]|uniref:(Mediterranean fruit fly) hypothetical protein n=1 Tax=Ceratitis capitata TaxID=7213 RepID=A0A811UQX8_CERCA|nr:unnamed protein product [Ceratitis capitata]